MKVEPGRAGEILEGTPLALEEPFPFVCAGCGDCCRERRDLVLSGYDLYRLARWLRLSPRTVAAAFCKSYLGEQTCLPTLCLTPDPHTGDCRFLEGGACQLHPVRPLACALYPLGQRIDGVTGAVEYIAQTPLCGVAASGLTLREVLQNAGVTDRAGVDARWAVECTRLSRLMQAHREHPHFAPAARRAAKALYFQYTIRNEFYPQFQQNMADLWPILDRLFA